jgi:hypothetical protein
MQIRLDFKISRKAQMRIFGGYDLYSYEEKSITDTNAMRAGAEFEYNLAKWISFSSGYNAYINKVDDSKRDIQIHRFSNRLNLVLSRSWRAWMGGGVDFSDYYGMNHLEGTFDSGISYTEKAASLSAAYKRSFTSASGISRLMQSDTVTGELGYRVTPRMSARFFSYYTKSKESLSSGLIKTLAGNAGLEYSVRNDLFLSFNASYQNQRQLNFYYGRLQVNRFSAYAGLQYVWPSRRRSDYQ